MIPAGFAVRPARPADAPALIELVRAYEEQYGTATFADADLAEEWAGADLERDTVLVETAAGTAAVVAYGLVTVEGEEVFVGGYVHPAWVSRGLGRALLLQLSALGAGRAPTLRTACNSRDERAASLFASQGFGFVRRYARMQIELDELLPRTPEPPAGVVLRAMRPGEERAFHVVTDTAFRGSWGYAALGFEEWLDRAQGQQAYVADLWIVAEEQGRLVGVARCLPERAGGGWVRSLAVHPAARGRGIGLALLHEAFRVFHLGGERIVGLGVDTENATGAFALYERAGMAVAEASDVWERHPAVSPVATA